MAAKELYIVKINFNKLLNIFGLKERFEIWVSVLVYVFHYSVIVICNCQLYEPCLGLLCWWCGGDVLIYGVRYGQVNLVIKFCNFSQTEVCQWWSVSKRVSDIF